MENIAPIVSRPRSAIVVLATLGPGLLAMMADTDVGNVAAAAQSGAQFGYRLLPLLIALIPVLYIVQEMTVRLGIFTGSGLGELIRHRFGVTWSWIAGIGLALVVLGSLVTEFTGVAGIGELYGVSRNLSLPLAASLLLMIVATGSYRRIEHIAIWIGLFELSFFVVAAAGRPDWSRVAHEAVHLPVHNASFCYLAAATIGACFNPWMMFYQQSAVVDKKLQPEHYGLARVETALGAVIAQLLTAAVLFSAATVFSAHGKPVVLDSVGQISNAMTPALGPLAGRLIFSAGVLGASIVAAIVCSLALTWGVGELIGLRRSMEFHPSKAKWFYVIYASGVVGAATVVWMSPDLLWLNIAAQVANVFMMPLVIGFLIVLARMTLPARYRLQGAYLAVTIGAAVLTCGAGLFAAARGLFGAA